MNDNKMTVFAQQLIIGGTTYSKSAARINGGNVGPENYALWNKHMSAAHEAFYRYEKAIDDLAHGKTVDLKPIRDAGMDAFKTILDDIGVINGFRLHRDPEIFADIVKYSIRETTEFVGEAMTVKSQLKNLADELKNLNGCNPDWLEATQAKYDELSDKLAELKKCADSGKPIIKRATLTSFCANFERRLASMAQEQNMKTWEELVAEDEERKEARRAAAKARRQAKRRAELEAKAK